MHESNNCRSPIAKREYRESTRAKDHSPTLSNERAAFWLELKHGFWTI
jgi:hypothetical protein